MSSQVALVKSFFAMLMGNAALVVSQGLQFVIVARFLGSEEFGVYSAILAAVMVLQPLVGFGQANVLIFRASRDNQVLGLHLGNALVVTWISGALFSLAAIGLITAFDFFPGRNVVAIVASLCVAELFFARSVETYAHAFIALEKVQYTSIALTLPSILRTVAIAPWLAFGLRSADSWAAYYCVANVLICSSLVYFLFRKLPSPVPNWKKLKEDIGLGLLFCIGFFSKAVYTDGDKPLLARYCAPEVLGAYASGARLVAMALMPIRALTFATQARLFRSGSQASGASRSLLMIVAVYGLLMAIFLWLVSSFVPLILGVSYASSVDVIKWLCLLPLFVGLQTLLADVLTGYNRQRQRTLAQGFSALLFITLCLIMIPKVGWQGAVVASYVSQILLVFALYYMIRKAQNNAA